MDELWELLSTLEISDLVLCAMGVLVLDLFAISVIRAVGKENERCQKRWNKVSAGMELMRKGQGYPLDADEILIGRHISADIRLGDPSVSRYHAVLTVSGGVWSITDLESRGGTFVCEQRVHSCTLHPGDQIRLGNAVLYLMPRAEANTKRRRGKQDVS